jgi:autotransporter translocation and assembly factor TamB
MRIVRRILRILGITTLLLLALVIGAVAVLTLTGKGRENLAGLISSMASSEDSSVQISGISGIWVGPTTIDSVMLSDKDGPWLALRGVAVDWSLLPLLSSRFEASLVHADRVELARLPASGESSGEGGGLPISLEIARIDLPQVMLSGELAGEVAQVSAEGSLSAEAEPLAVKADLEVKRSDGKEGAVDAKIDFAPAEDRLAIDVHGAEPAGGIIANFLKFPGAPPVEIALSGTGPAANWNLEGSFAVDGSVITSIAGKRQRTGKGNRVEVTGEGDFERFMPSTIASLVAGKSNLAFAGTFGDDGSLDIEHASLESGAVTAHALGSVYPSGVTDLSVELAARDAPATLSFGEHDAAVTVVVRSASVRAFGPGQAPILDVTASIEKVSAADVELSGIEAKIHSDAFDIANRAGPLTLSATAQHGGSVDETVAGLLVGALKLDATATVAGDKVHIDNGSFASDTARVSTSGDVSLADGSLTLSVEGDLLAAVLPEGARPALDSRVAVTATLARDAAGAIRLDPLRVASGGFSAAGSAAYTPDALDAQLKGSLTDLTKLIPAVAGTIGFDITAKGSPAAPDIVATVTSEKLTAGGREITGLQLSAAGKADPANLGSNLRIGGQLGGQAFAGEAVLSLPGGQPRIDGIALTLGENRIAGNLTLDEELVPQGALTLTLPDLKPLAALVPEDVAGALNGTVTFLRADGVPEIAIDATAASVTRGVVSVADAQVTARITNYLVEPAISGQVKAASLRSGTTVADNVDLQVTRAGGWTDFTGGASVEGTDVKAAGRLALAEGTTTVELASVSANPSGIPLTLVQPATVVVKDGGVRLDGLTLAVGSGSLAVSGTAAELLDIDVQLTNIPADLVGAFAAEIKASGALSGTVAISGNASAFGAASGSQPPAGEGRINAVLTANGAPATISIGAGESATNLAIRSAAANVSASGGSVVLDASASLDQLATSGVELSAIEAKLHSDAFDLARRMGPLTLAVTAGHGGSVDDTIAGLLAGALKLDATAALAGDKVHIDSGSFASDSTNVAVSGDLSLADGSLTLDVKGDVLAAVLPEAARPALDAKVAITATLARDAAGAIRLDPLSVVSGGFNGAGSVAYSVAALDARLNGSLADLTRLAPDVAGSIGFEISARGAPAAPDVVATISSDKLVASGREIAGLQLSATGKADPANLSARMTLAGSVAGEALAGEAVVRVAGGERRIEGLSLALGENRIAGNLALDEALVPEGSLALTLPDLKPLAALAPDQVAGALNGTVRFLKTDGVPEVAIDAKSASIIRGDLAVTNAEIGARIVNYMEQPAISGRIKAASVKSGTTLASSVDIQLTRDGSWTGFAGGAAVDGIDVEAAGRLALAEGTTTVELASASANPRGIEVKLAQPATVVVKDGGATLDGLTLAVGSGSVAVTGAAAEQLDLAVQLDAIPADLIGTFAPNLKATGALSGTIEVSGDASAITAAVSGSPPPAGEGRVKAVLTTGSQTATVTVGVGESATSLAIKSASADISASGGSLVLDASARLDRVATSGVDLAGVEAKLTSDGLAVANRTGTLNLSVTAESGTGADATISGLLAGRLRLEAQAALAADKIAITSGTFAGDNVNASVSGEVSVADASLRADVRADLLAALLPGAVRPALGDKVGITATLVRDGSGALRVDPLTIASGPFDAAGTVAYSQQALDVALEGGLADLSLLAPDTSGSIAFDITAKGPPSAPDLSASITSDKVTAVGREITGFALSASGKADLANPAADVSIKGNVAGQTLAGEAVLKTEGGKRRIDGMTLTLGDNRIAGDLLLDEAFVPEGSLSLTLPDIGPLAALALDQAAGAVNGSIRFSRVDGVPQVSIDAAAPTLTRGDLSLKEASVDALVVNYLAAPAVSGNVKALSVTSGTTVVSNVGLSLTRDGNWTGFNGGAIVNGIDAKASGRVSMAGDTTTVELKTASAAMRGITANLAKPTTVVVKGGSATLDRLTLDVGGGSVQVTGTAAQQLNLNVQLNAVPLSLVDAFAPGVKASGTASGTVRITGAAANPNIGYQLELKGVQTGQTRDAGFGAMAVSSQGTFGANVLKFTANVGDGSGLGMKGGGTINVGARNLSLDFSGQVPFGFLTRRLAAQGLALSGTSNVTLTLRGALMSPAVGGNVRASGVRLVDARSGLAINDIAVDVGIASGVATIRRLDGKLSSGGSLSASGTIGIDAGKGFPADITMKTSDARYTDGRIVTANLSGDVRLKGQLTAQPLLSGTINLAKTVITVPERLPGSASALGVVHKNAPAAVRQQEQAIRAESSADGNSGSGLTLDLTVNAPQQIYVRGRGLDVELGGSIKLTGPLASPRAIGDFTLRRGRLTLLSRRLTFTRGELGFSGSLIPTLDLAAESPAADATVTVTVTGQANDPKFNFSSSPALPQDEVLARLVFGRSVQNLSALQIAQLADAAAQLAGGRGSSGLFEKLRSNLGVDDLDVTTDSEGRTAVSAGKYLNDRTYVTIQQGERAGSGKATIDLDVGRGVKLRGEAGFDGSAKGGVFYEHEY